MNLIDEGDASFPDPVHVWKQLLGGHRQGKTGYVERVCRGVCC
jgi:hypothetical protein